MDANDAIYILGAGAIGLPLAAYLAAAGRNVIAVRTRRGDVPQGSVTVTVDDGANRLRTPVETISLSRLPRLEGTMVITTKAYANPEVARELGERSTMGPAIIVQNGIGVEAPFLDAGLSPVYRCVLYFTSQSTAEHHFAVRPVAPSPIGVVHGDGSGLERCVEALTTDGFPFRAEANIEREVWKKAISNTVFNSICPLLEVDNGIFLRSEEARQLARELVGECARVAQRLGLELSEGELIEQILRISRASDGQLISTLQDIRSGRPTEIEFLNLEIARVAAALQPGLQVPRVEMLGWMIQAKSALASLGRRE